MKALLAAGHDLDQALTDAPRKDGGFSPLTLAWVLQNINVSRAGREAMLDPSEIDELDRFKVELIDRLTRSSVP